MGLVTPQHVESSLTRDQTHLLVLASGFQHQTTREVPQCSLYTWFCSGETLGGMTSVLPTVLHSSETDPRETKEGISSASVALLKDAQC